MNLPNVATFKFIFELMPCILHLLTISLAWLSFFESNVHSYCKLKEEEKSTTIDGIFIFALILENPVGIEFHSAKLSEKLTPNIVSDGDIETKAFDEIIIYIKHRCKTIQKYKNK